MTISGITVGTTVVDLNTVGADVTIRIGRQDIFTNYATSAARITLYDVVTDLTEPYVGQTLEIFRSPSGVNFWGKITDAVLTVPTATSGATLTVTAVGDGANISYTAVGASGYPQQTANDRRNALGAEGVSVSSEWTSAENNSVLAAYTGGTTSARTILEDMAASTRSLVYTAPGGQTRIQSMSYRNTLAVQTLDETKTIFSPTWTQDVQVVNGVNVEYAGGTVSVTDVRSIALYGPRTATYTTTLVNQADATRLANLILARSKRPRWQLSSVSIIQSATEVVYNVGQPVKITTLPTGSPASVAYGVIEGWEHRYVGDRHTTTYFVSDPVQSGIALAWEDIPSGTNYQWQDVLPIVWDDAITLSDVFA